VSTVPHIPQSEPFHWEGVDVLAYKENDGSFQGVTRQILADAEHGQGVSLRYFEVAPGGHTTLEHHEHTHVVIPIRGAGSALVGDQVIELALNDVIFVPSWGWHQFRSTATEPLGFLCSVTVDRDRPVKPDADQIAAFNENPVIRDFIRY
jgi:mannose-6-phosphate isomerase-like protein (cupin superfamily)